MRLITLALLACLSAGSLQAQLSDRLVPHFGFMLEILTLEQDDVPNPQNFNYNFFTLGIGTYYVISHSKDQLSVGLDPSVQVGVQGLNGNIDWTLQAPVFLMGRFGAFATPYNTQKVGIGAGLGVVTSFASIRSLDGPGRDLDFNQWYAVPSIILEGSLNLPSGPLTGRLHLPLAKPVHPGVTLAGRLEPTSYNLVGLGLIYGF